MENTTEDKRVTDLKNMLWNSRNESESELNEIKAKIWIFSKFPKVNEGEFLFSLLYVLFLFKPVVIFTFIVLFAILAVIFYLFGAIFFMVFIGTTFNSAISAILGLIVYVLLSGVCYDWYKRKYHK